MSQPQFNPSHLVQLVMQMLGERFGIVTDMNSDRVHLSVTAAADLLRAIGVDPTTAPKRFPMNHTETHRLDTWR